MTSPLPIQRLHHVARLTRHPEASKAFYRDVLGFRELMRPNFKFRGAWLFNYGVQIHIIECREAEGTEPEKGPIDARSNHLAFMVSDLDAVRQTLTERGVPFYEQVNAGGIRQIFFQDPDGHHVEVAVYPENPPFADAPAG